MSWECFPANRHHPHGPGPIPGSGLPETFLTLWYLIVHMYYSCCKHSNSKGCVCQSRATSYSPDLTQQWPTPLVLAGRAQGSRRAKRACHNQRSAEWPAEGHALTYSLSRMQVRCWRCIWESHWRDACAQWLQILFYPDECFLSLSDTKMRPKSKHVSAFYFHLSQCFPKFHTAQGGLKLEIFLSQPSRVRE